MNVKELTDKLELTICSGEQGLTHEIKGGYISDLLSDVMGNAKEGQVWITLQTHKNIMAIASLKEVAAIILVKSRKPEQDTAEVSNDEQIPILSTPLDTFEIAGRLYKLIGD
ncbi:MAG: serine kinase [Prevotellaceae bacterium]|jgi:predicted transcriptional regulator|nr:serine kinase [Prevotellaceae bacterium]